MRSFGTDPLERRAAGAAFVTLAFVLGGHAVLETARDALFLRSLPPAQLPWVYLIIAVITLALTAFESTLARGARRLDLLSLFLFAAAVTTALLWALADFVSRGSIWILYVWTGVFGTLATIHFWLSVSSAFTVTQAKRIFGFVGAGALTGAIGGSALARVLVAFLATRHLVLLAACCMLVAGLTTQLLLRSSLRGLRSDAGGGAEHEPVRVRDALSVLRTEPYVRRVVLFVLLATVAITLADYLFKREVASAIAPAALGSFFATFYASLNVLGLIVQVLLVGWLLDRVGVPRTLAILPALLFGGGIWAALAGGLPAVLFLRGTNGSLKYSVHQTATEVLFVPLAGSERNRAKTVADILGHRIGQAVASLAILLGIFLVDGGRWVAWMIAATSLATMVLALRSRGPYLDVFRRRLAADARPGARRLPPLDRHALEVLFAALDSPREREVLASLDVFHEQGRIDLVPALILHHPSPRVVSRALLWFVEGGRRNFVSTALRVDTDDPDLRAALLRAIAAVEPDEAVLREALDDSSRRVRATAIVELTSLGAMPVTEARQRLAELTTLVPARRAVAAALGVRPCPGLSDLLAELARDDDLSVRAEAVHAIASSPDPSLFPVLLASLRERALRPIARRGFVAAGDAGLRFVLAALHDASLPLEVRLHVPRSISRFASSDAATLLWSRLVGEPDPGVRDKILRALSALARREGGLALDHEEVGHLIAAGLARAHRIVGWHRALARALADARRDTATAAVLRDLLEEELAHELEHVFRTLALRHPGEDFRSLQRGLASDDAVLRASCEELLSEVLPHEHRRALLALSRIDLASDALDPELPVSPLSSALGAMIDASSDAIAAIAASYACELGEAGLSERIAARIASTCSPEVRAVLEGASHRLDAREVASG